MVNCRLHGTMQGVCPREWRGVAPISWTGVLPGMGGVFPRPAFDDSSSSRRHCCQKEDLRHMLSCGCSRYGLLHVTKAYAQVTMVPLSHMVDLNRLVVIDLTLYGGRSSKRLVFPNRNKSRIYQGICALSPLKSQAAHKHTYEPPEVKRHPNCPHSETNAVVFRVVVASGRRRRGGLQHLPSRARYRPFRRAARRWRPGRW